MIMVGLNCKATSDTQTAILSSELSFQVGQTILVGLKICFLRRIVDVDDMRVNAFPRMYRISKARDYGRPQNRARDRT